MKKICNSCKREYHHGNDFLNNTSRWRMGPQDTLYFNCSCQSTLAMRLGKYDWYKPDINIAEGRKSLFHKLKLSEKLPMIQPAVYEIQYELSKADVSIQKVCGYLRKEPTLTATILGAATSKADRNISHVEHAIPYLGYQQVSDLVLAAAMNQFKVPSRYFSWDDFWAEAFLVGRISENLASEYLSQDLVDISYIGGCLANLGKVIIALYNFKIYDNIFEASQEGGIPWTVAESQYNLDHSVLGEIGACFWAFPDQITSIIEHHHDPEPCLSPQGMVAFANQIKHYLQDQKTLIDHSILESYNKFLGIDYQAYDRFLSCKSISRKISA